MKQIIFVLFAFLSTAAFSQKLPKISQLGTVSQTVGLNEITITYSRPNVNGRVVFGDLVSYDKVWRLGANECTKFTCTEDITIGNDVLPAGTYGMFAKITKNQWEIIFNSNSEQWGSYDLDPSMNILTYTAASIESSHTETLSITFEQLMSSSANIVIRWDNVMVSIPFTTDTPAAVAKEVQATIEKGEDLAKVYYNAADYYNDIEDTETAHAHLDKSLELERAYYNVFMKAQWIAEEDPKEAKKLADEAIKLAEEADKKGWVNHMKRLSKEWK
ncbi:MAG: DUF2911 domain-containing protein [Crocinitomicaceae bacterium]